MIILPLRSADREKLIGFMEARMRGATGDDTCQFRYWMPRTGIGAFDDDGKLVAGLGVYFEFSSPVAVAGFCIADPDNPPQVSHRAVVELLAALPQYAKKRGAKRLLTIFGNRGINRILARQGFTPGEAVEQKMMFLG